MTPTASDLASIRRRLQDLEHEVRTLSLTPPVPAALPVDKMQLADYGKQVAISPLAQDDDEEEIEVLAQPNLTRTELHELTSAVREYLEWSDPQSHLNERTWRMVSDSARERLERALKIAELELRRVSDA
jgi:hypothetical protein